MFTARRIQTARAILAIGACALVSACSGDARPAPSQSEAPRPARVVRAARLAPAAPRDTMKSVGVIGDSLEFAEITGVYPLGRHLLVTDRLMNFHMAVVDPASDSVVGHFGRHGEGPGEFGSISAVVPANRKGDQVWVYDFNNRRFTRLGLSDPARPTVLATVQSRIDAALLQPVLLGDEVVSNVLSSDSVLLFSRADGTERRRAGGDLAFDARTIPNVTGRRLLNRTYLARNGETGQLAVLFQFANRLDIFDARGTPQTVSYGPREHRAAYRVENDRFFWQPENVMSYAGVAATSRHIYALYCGCAMRDNGLPTRLHVFGWDGRFVAEIAFDRPVLGLTVLPGDSVIYAGTDEPHPLVARWTLPAYLRQDGGDSPHKQKGGS